MGTETFLYRKSHGFYLARQPVCIHQKPFILSVNVLQRDTEALPAHPLSLRLTATYLEGKNIQTLHCEVAGYLDGHVT